MVPRAARVEAECSSRQSDSSLGRSWRIICWSTKAVVQITSRDSESCSVLSCRCCKKHGYWRLRGVTISEEFSSGRVLVLVIHNRILTSDQFGNSK